MASAASGTWAGRWYEYAERRTYVRFLATASQEVRSGREVQLTHLKIAQTFEGSGSLEEGGGEVVAILGEGPAA